MALQGRTGTGKSTLVRDVYASQFPRVETPEGTLIPVFYVEMPSPATVKAAISTMLENLGDPDPYRGTAPMLDSRLVGLIKDCQTELVILDEFGNLIDTDTDRVLAQVSEWLKMLIKRTSIPFLVVGIDGKVEQILRANPQLSRLFAMRETLEPFAWQPTDPATIDSFNAFVTTAEKGIGYRLPTTVSRLDILYRLFYATDGVVGNQMNLLRYAVELAVERGQPTLDLPLLAQAYRERLAPHVRRPFNPFEAPADVRFETPLAPPNPANSTSPKKKRGRKPPALNDVLSAT